MFDSQTIRFYHVDPLTERFANTSPYVGMNNNPINLIDPSGMKWEDPEEAKRLKAEAQKRIDELNADSEKRRNEDREFSSPDEIKESDDQIEENNQMVALLTQSQKDIDKIGEAAETFRLVPGAAKDGTAGVSKNGEVIEIGGKTNADQLHEIRHIGQSLASGGMEFVGNRLINAAKEFGSAVGNEVQGYQVGFSMKGGYPVDGTKHLSQINGITLFMIKDENNKSTYDYLKELIK